MDVGRCPLWLCVLEKPESKLVVRLLRCAGPTHTLCSVSSLSLAPQEAPLSLSVLIFLRPFGARSRQGSGPGRRSLRVSSARVLVRPCRAHDCRGRRGRVRVRVGRLHSSEARNAGGDDKGGSAESAPLALGEGGGWGGGGEGGVLSQIICFRCHLGCHIIRYKLCVGCTDGETTARGMSTEQDLNCLLRR